MLWKTTLPPQYECSVQQEIIPINAHAFICHFLFLRVLHK